MAAANGFVTTRPDAIFGAGSGNPNLRGQKFTCGGEGSQEITRIGFWGHNAGAGQTCQLAIFTDDAANECPNTQVADSLTDELTFTQGASDVEITFAYSTRPVVTGGTDYWLVLIYSGSAGDGYFSRDTTGGTCVYQTTWTYPTIPSGDGWHTHTDSVGNTSLYAVYQAEGTPATGTVLSSLCLLGVG